MRLTSCHFSPSPRGKQDVNIPTYFSIADLCSGRGGSYLAPSESPSAIASVSPTNQDPPLPAALTSSILLYRLVLATMIVGHMSCSKRSCTIRVTLRCQDCNDYR